MKANKKTVKKVAPVKKSKFETMHEDLRKATSILNDMYYELSNLPEFKATPKAVAKIENMLDKTCTQLNNLDEAFVVLKDTSDLDAKLLDILSD